MYERERTSQGTKPAVPHGIVEPLLAFLHPRPQSMNCTYRHDGCVRCLACPMTTSYAMNMLHPLTARHIMRNHTLDSPRGGSAFRPTPS
jgi:hypothetical protein